MTVCLQHPPPKHWVTSVPSKEGKHRMRIRVYIKALRGAGLVILYLLYSSNIIYKVWEEGLWQRGWNLHGDCMACEVLGPVGNCIQLHIFFPQHVRIYFTLFFSHIMEWPQWSWVIYICQGLSKSNSIMSAFFALSINC